MIAITKPEGHASWKARNTLAAQIFAAYSAAWENNKSIMVSSWESAHKLLDSGTHFNFSGIFKSNTDSWKRLHREQELLILQNMLACFLNHDKSDYKGPLMDVNHWNAMQEFLNQECSGTKSAR